MEPGRTEPSLPAYNTDRAASGALRPALQVISRTPTSKRAFTRIDRTGKRPLISRRHPGAIATIALLLFLAIALRCAAAPFISNVNTDKALYPTGAIATVYVDLTNSTASSLSCSVNVTITRLGRVITNLPAQAASNLGAHSTTTKTFTWQTPAADYQGYLVSVSVLDPGSNLLDAGSSAIDVSSDWSKFPRYGYVAHFDAGLDAYNIIWQLKNYHLNGIQFYDWQWKHHIPYRAASSWPDIANRTISRATVTNLINASHAYGMMAMNYNLYGGAYSNYLSDGSGVTLAMGIFSGAPASLANQMSYPLPAGWATPRLCTMNNRDTNWQNYISAREQEVFSNFAFDGWHMDSLGQNNAWDYSGNNFNLADYQPQFINNARAALSKRMVYNSVDAVGENQVALGANVDFVYSELWSGNANYIDFKTRVDSVRSYGSKAVVFPAYMNYTKTSGTFNEASVRLADAAIFASGASHLELGDGVEMLRTGYFPENTVKMSASLKAVLRTYYDFLVGYQNLLRDGTVSASLAATITGIPTSTSGSAGAVWVISKKSLGYNLIHLVNLLNNTSTAWRDDAGTYPPPTLQTNLAVKMYYSGPSGGGKLWWASPDINSGAPGELGYLSGSDSGGTFVTFTVPQLEYWDMVWLEINGTNSAASQTRAANYDSMAGIGTESTSDTGGGLNVGFVNNTAGDSYLAFNNVDFGAGPSSVSARVASAAANGTIEFHLDSPAGTLVATVPVGSTGGWQSWQTAAASVSGASGVHKLFAVFKGAPSNLNWFSFRFPLPVPWITADVGSVGQAGNTDCSAGTFSVAGSGADIEGAADAFRYVCQPSSGACEVRARVVSVQNTDPWAKAGVMIRESTAPGAANAAVVVTPGNGLAFQRRTGTGGSTASTVVPGVAAPRWVRLARSASNSFRAYYSSDGTNWTQVGSAMTISMSNSVSAGLAVTAHNNATTCAATFDNVSLNQCPLLAAISNRALVAGSTLLLTNSASDADLPAQALTYTLLSAPAGAAVSTNSGVFAWRPLIAQSPATQTVSIAVSDNGTPAMSATQSFMVTVARPASPTLRFASASNGQPGFSISGDSGPDYTIQASMDLVSWLPVFTTNPPALPFLWTDADTNRFPARFYRAVLGP